MTANDYALSPGAFNAHLLAELMGATVVAGESQAQGQTRCAAIVEMFKALDPGSAFESAIACHCIALRYMLGAAMRDANDHSHPPELQVKLRAAATSISKTWQSWLARYEKIRARTIATATELDPPAEPPVRPAAPAAIPDPPSQPPEPPENPPLAAPAPPLQSAAPRQPLGSPEPAHAAPPSQPVRAAPPNTAGNRQFVTKPPD